MNIFFHSVGCLFILLTFGSSLYFLSVEVLPKFLYSTPKFGEDRYNYFFAFFIR